MGSHSCFYSIGFVLRICGKVGLSGSGLLPLLLPVISARADRLEFAMTELQ
jgi:hypothetical protein